MQTANQSCVKRCNECPNCYNLTEYRLRDILYAIDEKISQHSEYVICTLKWGYGCKYGLKEGDYEKLLAYKESIDKYYQSIRGGYTACLCPEEVQSIIEKTLDIVDMGCVTSPNRKDINIDESGLDLWVLQNPGCVAYEKWERGLIKACPLIGINVRSVDKSCSILSTVKEVEDKCKFLYTVSVYNIANSCITTKVTVNEKQCKLDYEVLTKKYECSFDFKGYLKLIECNMTPQVITNLLSCGVDVSYNVSKGCPEIKTNTKVLALCDTNVNVFSTSVDDALLAEFSGEDIDSYEVDKLIDSYVESCDLIREEINGA